MSRSVGRPLAVLVMLIAALPALAERGLVAASQADERALLDGLNRASEPRIDGVDIHGAGRTPPSVILRAIGVRPEEVLTRETFGRAMRRLREVPTVADARMTPTTLDSGLVHVDVFIDERHVLPTGWPAFATLGARAVLLHEARIDVAGPLGAGELTSATWRWSANRPRVVLSVALPATQWLRGVMTFNALWERQSYEVAPSATDATPLREERRRVGLRVSNWSTSWLRWQAGAAFDRLPADHDPGPLRAEPRGYFAVESALDARLADERLALAATVDWWAPVAGGDRFGAGSLLAAWRSTSDPMRPFWSALTEVSMASPAAPLALWGGAGTGQGRSGLLRAHPLLSHGVFTGTVFGRQIARGSLEYVRPVGSARWRKLAIAGFVDTARARHRLGDLDPSRMFIDAGVGLRVRAAGAGAIRIDVAHGLRGGGTTLSAGWGGAWPR